MGSHRTIAVTMGDVAGIGPEITARTVAKLAVDEKIRLIVIGSEPALRAAAEVYSIVLPPLRVVHDYRASGAEGRLHQAASGEVTVLDVTDDLDLSEARRGVHAVAGEAAYRSLLAGIQLTTTGAADALVTAPLNKASLHAAGYQYPGHTEILAEELRVSQFAMMLHLPESALSPLRPLFADAMQFGSAPGETSDAAASAVQSEGPGLSIVHATLHNAYREVPARLSESRVRDACLLMDAFLVRLTGRRQEIGVAALNPHGGESGLFGDEESRIISPAVESCRQDQLLCTGPLPVDTLIRRAFLGEFAGVVAMYHDQGHIPVKLVGFHRALNITLGLPIIRVSPTHGTAFDRAWQADTPSDARGLTESVYAAVRLFGNTQR